MIDNIIMIAIGVWATLIGFNKVRLSKNTEANAEYIRKYGIIFRICGIVDGAIGIVIIIVNFIKT
jgi:hypothetical protein